MKARSLAMTNTRLFTNSPCLMLKDIVHTETDGKIVVEGVPKPADTKTATLNTCGGGQAGCHPFCKSPIVTQVKHTDVLILDQFVDSKGQMYSEEELNICKRQWVRLHKLVQMCQRSGLMPGKEFYCADIRKTKWGSQNCYWDDKTIDIQWNSNKEKIRKSMFKYGVFKD